ncbi:hypothetical protein BDN72DRAFT_760500 [Pluteus cervinus]|uniref:Uncharacterized protein n=1 Tax=Pluteus cervinus TaxID=181527 RepID=A0ACD3B8K4_9AGAR|nr:hypothetical protein BDN72DRAFT_760500 [Pluteus cervinus]
MSSLFPIVFFLVIALALMTAGALFTPKGPQQVLIRTMIMMTVASCYLIWAITFLAQLHPLVGE